MDRSVIESRLESLRRCVARIEAKRVDDVEVLRTDIDLQDILSLNIERSVQVCVDVANHIIAAYEVRPPATMGEAFEILSELDILPPELAERMRKAVGFRNVAVHAYTSIDWNIVHAISHDRLGDLQAFARHVMNALAAWEEGRDRPDDTGAAGSG